MQAETPTPEGLTDRAPYLAVLVDKWRFAGNTALADQPITLGSGGTAHSMYRAILKANGEGFPATRDLEVLRARACEVMQAAGTDLIIIDEAHEGVNGSIFGPTLTSELKALLNEGVVGIVLLGTEKAEKLIAKNEEFQMRTLAPCRLGALEWSDPEDQELWIGFLAALEAEMLRLKLVSEPIGLADPDLAKALCEACSGVIGQLMKVVLHALRIAIHEDRDFVAMDDLAEAVNDWSMALSRKVGPARSHLLIVVMNAGGSWLARFPMLFPTRCAPRWRLLDIWRERRRRTAIAFTVIFLGPCKKAARRKSSTSFSDWPGILLCRKLCSGI